MKKFKPFLWVLGMFCVLALAVSPSIAAKKPNVVVMMVDNLGWGELGVYGGGELRGAPTPRLDKLAQEGMRLLNFNVEPQCTPTRSAFMTSRRPIRSGTTKVVWGVLYGLTNWEVTIAELMSELVMPLECLANGMSAMCPDAFRQIRVLMSGMALPIRPMNQITPPSSSTIRRLEQNP